MRVISGSAKSLSLKTIEGISTRPTTDRIKETLFNMIQPSIPDCIFLDLFSGSGAIGIEALSRGAKNAIFVENNQKAVKCIEENLKFTKLYERARILSMDAFMALKKLDGMFTFDLIFMDPPYQLNCEEGILRCLSNSSLLHENTSVIIEADLGKELPYTDIYGFEIVREKKYKTSKHLFLKLKKEA